jgi:16S rRNA (cytosine967-C5)-methyltransferase
MKQKTVREAALDVLLKIEKNQAYSNLLINDTIKKNRFEPRDTALLTQLVYGTVQHKNKLDFFLQPFLKKNNGKLELWVRVLLRLAVYQMSHLERIPDRAIVHETVEIAKRFGHRGISGLVNGVLRSIQREGLPDTDQIADPLERIAVETSHPEWLIRHWLKQHDKETVRAMCETNNTPPLTTARVNTTKASVDEVLTLLEAEGLQVRRGDLAPEAIVVEKGSLPKTETFQRGFLMIQDESSMLAAHALDVSEGLKVLDSCAAPGGKTTHIATLMNNRGSVTALDLHSHKVKLIDQAVNRLGLTNVHTASLDAREAAAQFPGESFDRILIDAPCSGFGVIRRKPDIKWGKGEADIGMLSKIQSDLLEAVSPLLKPGGKLVYSTCTIEAEENGEVVSSFLNRCKNFSFDRSLAGRLPEKIQKHCRPDSGSIQILPHYFQTDGFYITVLQKNE